MTDICAAPPRTLEPADGHRVAEVERRLSAFVLDRLLAWCLYAGAVWASSATTGSGGGWASGVATVIAAVLVVWVVSSLLVGLAGVSLGKAVLGLRVLSAEDARPIGVGRGLLRTLVLGLLTLPTAGFGAAWLAWSAMVDPSGRRRGWHDVRVGSVVVDVRPLRVVEEPEEQAPNEVVNLTALRLIPASLAAPASSSAAQTPRLLGAFAAHAGPPGPPGPPGSAGARWQVTFDSGEQLEVSGLTLVGRRPQARPGERAARLVALPSDDMSLSKTHAQLEVAPDGALVAMDRGSTNGSMLVRAGLSRRLPSTKASTLRDGDRVRFGDRELSVTRLDRPTG